MLSFLGIVSLFFVVFSVRILFQTFLEAAYTATQRAHQCGNAGCTEQQQHYHNDDNYLGETTTYNENYAIVSTGKVNADKTGVQALNQGGQFDITVNGNVTVSADQTERYDEYVYDNYAAGIRAESQKGDINISVNGGLTVESKANGSDSNTVSEGGENHRLYGDGVKIKNKDGNINIDIAGNVDTAEGTGVKLETDFDYYSDDLQGELNGDASIRIDGDIIGENGIDVDNNGKGDGTVSIVVEGDVITTDAGIKLGKDMSQYYENFYGQNPEEENGEDDGEEPGETDSGKPAVDIVVKETISGKKPILVANVEAVKNFVIRIAVCAVLCALFLGSFVVMIKAWSKVNRAQD